MPRHFSRVLLADPGTQGTDGRPQRFLDIFNHRLISLFYRAWEKYRFAIAYERGGQRRPFSQYLYCLIGLGTPGLRGRLHIDDQICCTTRACWRSGRAPRWRSRASSRTTSACPSRSCSSRAMVRDERRHRCRASAPAGRTTSSASAPCCGSGSSIRRRVSGSTSGPLSYPQFRDFLPGADGYRATWWS